jgi:hypothetical protein
MIDDLTKRQYQRKKGQQPKLLLMVYKQISVSCTSLQCPRCYVERAASSIFIANLSPHKFCSDMAYILHSTSPDWPTDHKADMWVYELVTFLDLSMNEVWVSHFVCCKIVPILSGKRTNMLVVLWMVLSCCERFVLQDSVFPKYSGNLPNQLL